MRQRFSFSAVPSPNFLAHARMQASTASACLRKLSDWVNSVSSSHACSRVWMVPSLKVQGLRVKQCYIVRSTAGSHRAMSELAKWDNFYVIVGSAAGALIGLQFVVLTHARVPVRHRSLRAHAAFRRHPQFLGQRLLPRAGENRHSTQREYGREEIVAPAWAFIYSIVAQAHSDR